LLVGGSAKEPEDLGLEVARVRPPVTVDLPARTGELTALGSDMVAHGVMSDTQRRVVAPVSRRRNLSTRKLRGDYPPARLERRRHQYRLSIPLPVPGKLFWSVTVYGAETRSQVQAEQGKAALRSLFEPSDLPATASAELRFDPRDDRP
jgi:hypothetical protein